MADETKDETTEKATAAPTTGLIGYIVKHHLLHDGHDYLPGEVFQHADAAVIAALRNAKAIALPTEVQAADEVAQRMADLEAQLASARAENARLQTAREQMVTPPASEPANEPAADASSAKVSKSSK